MEHKQNHCKTKIDGGRNVRPFCMADKNCYGDKNCDKIKIRQY